MPAEKSRVDVSRGEEVSVVLEQLCQLFEGGAATASPERVQVFDRLFGALGSKLEPDDLARLASRLEDNIASLPELRRLAEDRLGGAPLVKGADLVIVPLQSSADEPAFVERRAPTPDERDAPADQLNIARHGDLAAMLELASRSDISATISNSLVSRGNRTVLYALTANPAASFARSSLTTLVELAPSDRTLKENLAARTDLPESIVERLLPFLAETWKARAIIGVPTLTPDEANMLVQDAETARMDAASSAATDIGEMIASARSGTLDMETAVCRLAGEGRVVDLAKLLAAMTGCSVFITLNFLAARLDQPVCQVVKAVGAGEKALLAVLELRRRCGFRNGHEQRAARMSFARINQRDAVNLVAAMRCVMLDMEAGENTLLAA